MAPRWHVDPMRDAHGFHTIRLDDGSEHGDCAADPIATVYDPAHAALIAEAPRLREVLAGFLPGNLNLANPALLDSAVVPLDFTVGELRAASAVIAFTKLVPTPAGHLVTDAE